MKQDETSSPDESELMADGAKYWYKGDTRILHRLDGPAVERARGYREWWKNGELHRSNGPAIEDAKGNKQWWENGNLHRLDGPAIEYVSGSQEWWVNHVQIRGPILDLFKQAVGTTTPSSKVGELSHHENYTVALGAVHNPNCPLEDQVEWALTQERVSS